MRVYGRLLTTKTEVLERCGREKGVGMTGQSRLGK